MITFNRYPSDQQIINRCTINEDDWYPTGKCSEMEKSIAEFELIIESAEDVVNDANIDDNLKEVLLWMLEKIK